MKLWTTTISQSDNAVMKKNVAINSQLIPKFVATVTTKQIALPLITKSLTPMDQEKPSQEPTALLIDQSPPSFQI